jgi:microcystin-dependent protein
MPNTVNKALNTPNTGDLSGAWGTTAVNNNMTVIDGYLAGVQTVSLTNANVSLSISTGSIGTGSITAGAGPVQSANAVVKFSGTLSGNCTITFPCPGFWIVENNCTVGTFYVAARASGTGNVIGIPPGEPCHIYNDGTDAKFVDMGRVGEFLDLCVSTTPAWMSACTVLPYLPCVGSTTYSFSTYPALAAMLGSTFGGNGVTTFGVPDLGGRVRLPIDSGGTRITFAGSNITGTLFGASGGAQNQSTIIAHSHAVTDPGHVHTFTYNVHASSNGPDVNDMTQIGTLSSSKTTVSTTTGISLATTGSATALVTVPPALVFGVTFIKT